MIIAGKGYDCRSQFIFDGDTLNLSHGLIGNQSEVFKARLQWIDAPEAKKTGQNSTNPKILEHWEFAEKAKIALSTLVEGKLIMAVPIAKDQFDRWVCNCYVERISIKTNLQIILCKLGLAVSSLPFNRFSYNTNELSLIRGIITETANANRKKVGIWSSPNFILPYEFKKLTIN